MKPVQSAGGAMPKSAEVIARRSSIASLQVGYLSQRKTKQLNAFLEKIFEPLPDDVLLDTHYNLLQRQARFNKWRNASLKCDYFEAMKNLAIAHESLKGKTGYAVDVPTHLDCLDLYRKALANKLITPAPSKVELDWKRKQKLDFLPIAREEIQAMIADDEAFLAAHPTKAKSRVTRGRAS